MARKIARKLSEDELVAVIAGFLPTVDERDRVSGWPTGNQTLDRKRARTIVRGLVKLGVVRLAHGNTSDRSEP